MLQSVAVCRSVLQCIAVCCSMLQCVAVYCSSLQYVAMCCSVLQNVAVWLQLLFDVRVPGPVSSLKGIFVSGLATMIRRPNLAVLFCKRTTTYKTGPLQNGTLFHKIWGGFE